MCKDVDQRDPRGRTLLHLAVSLGYIESAKVLLQHKADVTKENAQGWTVLHEAVSTGDPEMVQLILQHRDYQQTSMTLGGVPELLQKINETPDFYVEMKWEFTSWVPLVSRVCPSDVCRIWKSRAKLRVDITLLGFENMSWERGRRTVIFKGEDSGGWAELIEINHDDKFVTTERFEISQHMKRLTLGSMTPKRKDVERRLTSPIISTCLDTKNIAFERSTSGFWVWRTEKSEGVNGYEAKVYTANNVNVITRIRTEHLTEEEKRRYKADRSPLESFLGTVEHECGAQSTSRTTEYAATNNPTAITLEEYFNPEFDLKGRDIGRPKEVTVRTQKFKATLWMSEEFPLSLMEQVTPIIDLMARTSAHFARLRDFITLEFPPGFPVKIEIPLFHVLNARITFENVNSCRTAERPSPGGAQSDAGANFEVDQSVFEIPKSYHVQDDGRNIHVQDEDNEIMQFAIQQSLLESGANKELEMLSNGAVAYSSDFNMQYQKALQESFLSRSGTSHSSSSSEASSFEKDLQLAMELSVREQEEQEKQRQEQEDAELQQVLQLSLVEK
ncbi:ankyrin repeat domain-containing protein 13A isoform X2 [Melospiza melodia melodia]|uniref:ankyrin repeat domain-containing protein 13A isoform X2 n=1 Tax=Melospiza georgiana TaxID=44398 RepID=UPI0025ACD20E|nr:ankyrin repeat domain-containing protein 13A isoform X2 [Melospiza georgiana]XP_057893140.1 ankyrin repeat domain-containing protein 13A isoform X2 [Melospiza georgiana]